MLLKNFKFVLFLFLIIVLSQFFLFINSSLVLLFLFYFILFCLILFLSDNLDFLYRSKNLLLVDEINLMKNSRFLLMSIVRSGLNRNLIVCSFISNLMYCRFLIDDVRRSSRRYCYLFYIKFLKYHLDFILYTTFFCNFLFFFKFIHSLVFFFCRGNGGSMVVSDRKIINNGSLFNWGGLAILFIILF